MLYTLNLKEIRAYLFTTLFVAGNLLLPFVCHHMPQVIAGVNDGLIWLPIYFFTLIAAYKFGIQVGLLTAIASPLVNSLLFGMPVSAMLPSILLKSVLLAIAAAYFAHKAGKVSFLAVLCAVIAYQFVGTAIEWIGKDFYQAIVDIRIGFPGILLQIFGGYAVLKMLKNI